MQIPYAAISECAIHVRHGGAGKVNHAAGGAKQGYSKAELQMSGFDYL